MGGLRARSRCETEKTLHLEEEWGEEGGGGGREGRGEAGFAWPARDSWKARDLKNVFDKPPALTVVMCTNSDFGGFTNHCRELSLLSTGRLVSISSLAYDGWRNTCHLAMFT